MDLAERLNVARKIEGEWAKRVSPPGALGLPALLDERRIKYQIPDAAFARAAMLDKILLFQIPMWEGDTYGDTKIVMSQQGRKRQEEEAPRGIIISAGLEALDVLHANGCGLGHIVLFVRLSPWRVPYEMIEGHEVHLIPLRVGDLIADEDAAAARRRGEQRVDVSLNSKGYYEHRLVGQDGAPIPTVKAQLPGDF